MNSSVFTAREASTLHKTTRFLRRLELDLPGTADPKRREGVLHAALALEEQADNLNSGPASTLRETRRPLFNHLVAPVAGGLVFPDEAKAMLDAHEDAARTEGAQLAELHIKAALLELHPKTANPTHGCCAPPKACNGHRPECRSSDHGLERKEWPCATLRAVGITSDADADAVLAALVGPEGCPRNVIERDVGRHFFKKGALSDSPIACIYCGNPSRTRTPPDRWRVAVPRRAPPPGPTHHPAPPGRSCEMTPYEYERFLAEAIPTGRFGRPDVDSEACQEAMSTPQQQAARRATLDEAQRGWLLPDERSRRDRARKRASRPPHLHLVPDMPGTWAA